MIHLGIFYDRFIPGLQLVKDLFSLLRVYQSISSGHPKKDRDTDHIFNLMNETMDMFLNRYCLYDIFQKKPKKFKKFNDRIDKCFDPFIHTLKDRLEQIF